MKTFEDMKNALFSIGQRVVCVDSMGSQPQLIEDKEYTVERYVSCKHCGKIGVAVNVPHRYKNYKCCICDLPLDGTNIFAVYGQHRFVPLEFDRMVEEEIHQALKGIEIKI